MTNLINEIELAYAGKLTVNQGWERHGLLAILKMFNNDVQEVIDELVTSQKEELDVRCRKGTLDLVVPVLSRQKSLVHPRVIA